MELYGRSGLSHSDECQAKEKPPAVPVSDRPKEPRRAYTGWVGEYGAPHTKSVPEQAIWDFGGSSEEDNDEDDFLRSTLRPSRAERSDVTWDFDEYVLHFIERYFLAPHRIQREAERVRQTESQHTTSRASLNWETYISTGETKDDEEDVTDSVPGDQEGKLEFESDDPAFAWLRP